MGKIHAIAEGLDLPYVLLMVNHNLFSLVSISVRQVQTASGCITKALQLLHVLKEVSV
jgi:hypothetical protein